MPPHHSPSPPHRLPLPSAFRSHKARGWLCEYVFTHHWFLFSLSSAKLLLHLPHPPQLFPACTAASHPPCLLCPSPEYHKHSSVFKGGGAVAKTVGGWVEVPWIKQYLWRRDIVLLRDLKQRLWVVLSLSFERRDPPWKFTCALALLLETRGAHFSHTSAWVTFVLSAFTSPVNRLSLVRPGGVKSVSDHISIHIWRFWLEMSPMFRSPSANNTETSAGDGGLTTSLKGLPQVSLVMNCHTIALKQCAGCCWWWKPWGIWLHQELLK